MVEGLCAGGVVDALLLPGAEGAAGCRQQQLGGGIARRTLQALEDGAVLAVHRKQGLTDGTGRVHHQMAAGDQCLLVGQQHLTARMQRIHHALQTGDAHYAHQHHVRGDLRGGDV